MIYHAFALLHIVAIMPLVSAAIPDCTSFHTNFADGSVAPNSLSFIPYSTPSSSYAFGPSGGLELILQKPSGDIKKKGRVNSEIASGATINSTFLTLYGKFSFTLQAPRVPGVVVAAILIAPGGDEIDIELLGGDPHHWQTNIFAPQPSETQPLYDVFGGLESYGSSSKNSVNDMHTYSIDWNAERIIWGVDGRQVRTIAKSETKKNGVYHYPSHAMRIQLGIWDASSPEGTSEWAKGPINWGTAPSRMTATFKSLSVECP